MRLREELFILIMLVEQSELNENALKNYKEEASSTF